MTNVKEAKFLFPFLGTLDWELALHGLVNYARQGVEDGATSNIHNVLLEHGGLPHVFPLAVQGTTPRPFYSLGWVVRGSSVGLASCRVGPASLGVAQMAIKDR